MKKKTSLKGIGFLFGAVAGFLLGPASAAAFEDPPAPYCTAEDPVEFLCSCEFDPGPPPSGKWRSITVDSSAVSSGGSCENSCTFSYEVSMTAKSGTYGTYDVVGHAGTSTVTFDASNPTASFSNGALSVECGSTHLFDVSYQAGNCPTSNPDGPGACSIVAITFICGPNC